ncbi:MULTISPECIES: acyl carrier protein [Actinomadura]|uniref:Acyl carrier protein n=1 Tax=Actinomadura yumaensis TaxID=111807 RepID=A0ABW2CLM4_9ACTN|nr:acyl carrier protein [Actinomadura sp. J1-007]MWK40679.1 phosphopantetheine-binding protein [Actinomadura sp. J1-007]QFU19833.1 ACP [Actinomadura sp.]
MHQQATNDSDGQAVLDGTELQEKLAAAGPPERERILGETVREQAAAVLDQSVIDLDSNFLEKGLTSLKALELTRNLMSLTGIEIPLVAVIEHPTPVHLGRFMAELLAESGDGAAR